MADVKHLPPEAAPVVHSEEKRGRRFLWLILLLLALVALVLTAVFGHYALGPRDTIKVSFINEQGLGRGNEKTVSTIHYLFAERGNGVVWVGHNRQRT